MLSSYITELTLKTINIIDNIFNYQNEKNYIIDPLTCIIRLGMLYFKETGTKITYLYHVCVNFLCNCKP